MKYASTVPPPALVLKYETLFKNYDCFTKAPNYVPKKIEKRRPHIIEKKKSLQSLWNILNETNFLKVAQKIRFMVSDLNIENVVEDLLKNAILHASYRKFFLLVLQDIHKHHPAYLYVQAHYLRFLESHNYLLKNDTNLKDYDLFCHRQKTKGFIISSTMLYLDASAFISLDIESYARLIGDLIRENPDVDTCCMYVQIITEICKYYPQYKPAIDWRTLMQTTESIKLKFMIEKLLPIP